MTPADEIKSAVKYLRASRRRMDGWSKHGHIASALAVAESAIDSTIHRLQLLAKKMEAPCE